MHLHWLLVVLSPCYMFWCLGLLFYILVSTYTPYLSFVRYIWVSISSLWGSSLFMFSLAGLLDSGSMFGDDIPCLQDIHILWCPGAA